MRSMRSDKPPSWHSPPLIVRRAKLSSTQPNCLANAPCKSIQGAFLQPYRRAKPATAETTWPSMPEKPDARPTHQPRFWQLPRAERGASGGATSRTRDDPPAGGPG
jgi:hypothetical protein